MPRCALLLFLLALVPLRAQQSDTTSTVPESETPAGESEPTVAGKVEGRTITLSDFGAEDLGYLAVPNTQPSVAIVIIPDVYGLDDFTKGEVERLAGLGYIALAVDIYNGHKTTDPEEIANLTQNEETASVMKTIDAGIRVFSESPKFRVGHVVTMGWGNGARFSLEEARVNHNIDGAIMFYGPLETNVEKIGHFLAPICAVYPQNDPNVDPGSVQVFQRMMRDAGNDFSAWFIAAKSGWSNPSSASYNPVEDKEAWKVVMPFLVKIGAEPVREHKASLIDKAKDKIESIFH